MRHLIGFALLAQASVAFAAAYHGPGPVTEFPTRFADHGTVRASTTATYQGRTIRQRHTATYDDVLVFESAKRLRFEAGTGDPFDVVARWTPLSDRIVSFAYTTATFNAAKRYLNDASGLPTRVRLHVARGRLNFAEGRRKYRGSQVIRAWTNYRGVAISVVELVSFRGEKL